MRVYTIISSHGEGWAIGRRISSEGHRVLVYINDESKRILGDGIVDKHPYTGVLIRNGVIDDWTLKEILMPRPDVVIITSSTGGFGKLADVLRRMGIAVIGGNSWGELLETNIKFKNQVFEMLRYEEPDEELLKGIRVGSLIWFNGEDCALYLNVIPYNYVGDRDKGSWSRFSGAMVWSGNYKAGLFKKLASVFMPVLRAQRFSGVVYVESRVLKDKDAVIEFTFNPPLEYTYIGIELLRDKVSDFYYGVANYMHRVNTLKATWGMGVGLSAEADTVAGEVIGGIKGLDIKHLWLNSVYKDDEYLCAGVTDSIGVVTAWGAEYNTYSPIREAKRRVMRTISNLNIPNLMYRDDIGDRVQQENIQLTEWGWV